MTRLKVSILTLMALSVVGCVLNPSEPVSTGKDTYTMNVDARGGYSQGQAQVAGVKKANAFCAQQGKAVIVHNATNTGTAGWTPVSSVINFSCLSADDPEYKRSVSTPPTTTSN